MNDPYKLLVLHCVDAAAAEYISGRMNMQEAIEYEMQYKVTISDEVSMNKFNEKYEILEQDGRIFTIRERAE